MWIKSQDGKQLTKVKRLFISSCKEGTMPTEYIVKWRIINQVLITNEIDDYDVLGNYVSLERALAVLDQIHQHINNYQYSIITGEHYVSKIFVMPEK